MRSGQKGLEHKTCFLGLRVERAGRKERDDPVNFEDGLGRINFHGQLSSIAPQPVDYHDNVAVAQLMLSTVPTSPSSAGKSRCRLSHSSNPHLHNAQPPPMTIAATVAYSRIIVEICASVILRGRLPQ